jgi:hypothetical protein
VFEKAVSIFFAQRQFSPRCLALRDVFDGNKDTIPLLLGAWQNPAAELDIEALSGECVVDRVTREFPLPFPELNELADMGVEHIVAENLPEIRHQMIEVVRFEQRERLVIDLHDPDPVRAGLHPRDIGQEVSAKVCDA